MAKGHRKVINSERFSSDGVAETLAVGKPKYFLQKSCVNDSLLSVANDDKLPRCSLTLAKAGARKGENPPAGSWG